MRKTHYESFIVQTNGEPAQAIKRDLKAIYGRPDSIISTDGTKQVKRSKCVLSNAMHRPTSVRNSTKTPSHIPPFLSPPLNLVYLHHD